VVGLIYQWVTMPQADNRLTPAKCVKSGTVDSDLWDTGIVLK